MKFLFIVDQNLSHLDLVKSSDLKGLAKNVDQQLKQANLKDEKLYEELKIQKSQLKKCEESIFEIADKESKTEGKVDQLNLTMTNMTKGDQR